MTRLKSAALSLAIAAGVLALSSVSTIAAAGPAQPASTPAGKLPDWKDYIDALRPIGDEVIGETANPDDPQSRQDSWNLMFAQLARIYLVHVYADPDYPEFAPLYNAGLNVAAPNPDYMYFGTPMDGHGTYRLRGFKGTNRFTFLQFTARDFTERVTTTSGVVLGGFALSDVQADAQGNFELILSAEKPQGYTGNWIKLDERTRSVFMRTASYDWINERDPVVAIERLDRPARRPRESAEAIAAKLAALPGFVREDSLIWWRHMADLQKRNLWNRMEVEPWGAFPGQVYLEGLYRLADDEALILETDIPKNCRYWSFLVGDMQFRTIDWVNHQSNLNGFQAKLDADGKFRAVISQTDPGVPNWLDPGGYREGVIQGRWNVCDSAPVPTAKVVKLSQLRRNLPSGTPVVTPQERERQLRDRHMGAQMRRKW